MKLSMFDCVTIFADRKQCWTWCLCMYIYTHYTRNKHL